MPHTYAIADLHGRFDLLEAAIEAITGHAGGAPGTVITLGDYVDRGPDSRKIIERLMLGLSDGWRLVCLQGNHEDMMLQTLSGKAHPSWWIANGGGATLLSYGASKGQTASSAFPMVPDNHVAFLEGLPFLFMDEHRIYVHAGVDPTKALHDQTQHDLQWRLYPKGFAEGHGDFHVVHGHEQFEDGPKLFKGRTDLDTFAWATGRLVIGVFDDDTPGGPVDLIEVQKAPHHLMALTRPQAELQEAQ